MARLKNHPNFWLRDDAAAAFDAYEDKYGVRTVNSAGRTEAEQQGLINRWDKGGAANRPPYLYAPARPARASNHVKDGGIALDIADWRTFKEHSAEFGFHWFGNSDVVHFDFRGWNGAKRGGYQDGSNELRIFQEKLIRMGHDLGPTGADSVLGAKTKAATLFEQQMAEKNGYPGGNVADDGIPGPQINGYLDWWLVGRHQGGGRPSSKSAGEVNYADIQTALNRHGYNLKVDNIWGPKSSNALADFQAKNGLKVDRLVGPLTWDKLNR